MIETLTIETAYGLFIAEWTERGLYSLQFPDPEAKARFSQAAAGDVRHQNLALLLTNYLQGDQVDFGVIPVDWSGYTPFQRRVLEAVAGISSGNTLSYGTVAVQIGRPGAARAVGNAVGINRTPVVVPCHRVVRGDGSIGGFSGGAGWKERLLAIEGIRLYSTGNVAI